MAQIDQYLVHRIEAERSNKSLFEEVRGPQGREALLPMLVRVTASTTVKDMEYVPDCEVSSMMGNIVACRGSIKTIEVLQQHPGVISVEASRPSSGYECAQSVPFVHADDVQNDVRHPEKGEEALIAIIDSGIDVFHNSFQDDRGGTKIISIWDQRDSAGPAPKYGYGTLHTSVDIDGYIRTGSVPSGLGRDPDLHGTHVASIAAGRSTAQFFGGVAPESKIILVIARINVAPSDPYSIGYSNSHVDALSFIADEASRLAMPVVVNVSQGMNAGAHDGTSNLEAAFDNFSGGGRLPGRAIVKSAGNERGSGGHSQFKMATNSTDQLTWTSLKPHNGPDVVELWFRACDELSFQLVNPDGEISQCVGADQPADNGSFQSKNRYIMTFDKFHWDNGDSRLLVTIVRDRGQYIDAGDWRLDVHARSVRSDGTIDAWLERDVTRPIRFTNHQREECTLSVPGTARTVISVGSVGSALPVKVAGYSSYGPTRDLRVKPDLVAPGEVVRAAAAGTFDGTDPKSGTSMAAPHVAGAIALLFSAQAKRIKADPAAKLRQFNAAQIRAALGQTAQNYNGHATPSMGYGVLDVRKFIDAFL